MGRFSGIRNWRFKQATKLEKKEIDKFGVGFARFLYETLRVACFPVGVRHHTLDYSRLDKTMGCVAREYR
ncbi:MAG: hypothetical protein V7K88_08195 [Nostoc sp.]|uniref:hypothetical protein n=1 Tax=Nostoc sp. TaxID=1180 RepID=UPI002FFB1110